ncbi:MAG: M15 family metallopeptidase [Desulfobacteraceae bacterium]|nr:M15 family metallopeptidase [Desulfobacteraceae bacterium]
MKRRTFLSILAAATATAATPGILHAAQCFSYSSGSVDDTALGDYLQKMRRFDRCHPGDVFLDPRDMPLLHTSLQRLRRLERTVGHGNFYLLGFDDALKIAKNYVSVGAFEAEEIVFMERLFYEDGRQYGFLGEKPLKSLTDRVRMDRVVKIPHSGNYLYQGRPVRLLRRICREVGEEAVLTSGIRSVIKQFILFLNKTRKTDGNLSQASRSLAPPGYSFHGVGDFDVGQRGYGAANFTERFTETRVFNKLKRLGYLRLRYRRGNLLGVRFEPWHIKVNDIS